MAPIPSASAISSMPALLASPWLKWSLLVVFAILLVLLAALVLVWVYRKATKSVSTFIERVHERKLVLPTHLDPRMSRPIVLPLPPNLTSMIQTVNAESPIVNNDDAGTKFISAQFCLSLWLSTSLDHITLDHCLHYEESIDEPEACDTPALSPSLDTDNDSYDSSLQTPPLESAPSPVSHFTKDLAVVDDNYEPAADIRVFGALTPTTAFTGSLCLADLCLADLKGLDSGEEESFYSQDSFISSDSLYDPGIPNIVISEALDDTCSRYPYESPTLPSTPSTAALYTLGLPTLANESHEPPSTSLAPAPAPIPIPFSPTLHADSYIWVPPPGSDEYFLSFEPASNDEGEPQHDEEPSPDLSRLGLRSTSGSSNVANSDNNGCTFDWNRLLAQEAELDYEQVDRGLRSAFSTDSNLAFDEDEDDLDSDEEPSTNLPHPGLRLQSTIGSGNVASDDGGTFDWNRLGGGQEDSGLRSAFSTDSDLATIDEEDEEDEDEEEYDEEEEYAPDSEEAPPSNMSRQGLWSPSDNMDVASEDIGTYKSEDSGLRSAFSTDSDLAIIDEEDEEEEDEEKNHDEDEGGDDDKDEDEDEDAPDSEEAPPSNMSRQGLRSTSNNMEVASEDIGTDYDWQQEEDSGLRSAFSTDSDLAIIDEEDEEDEEDDGDEDEDEEEEADADDDDDDDVSVIISRLGLWPPTYGCDATTEQPHSAKRHEQP
ncbi:hypothetical protein BC629DRAFT_1720906 [Irpex lacteus]|nr:hypothetical protein BC629DRAFT_1720906 [Irpex lacteus]